MTDGRMSILEGVIGIGDDLASRRAREKKKKEDKLKAQRTTPDGKSLAAEDAEKYSKAQSAEGKKEGKKDEGQDSNLRGAGKANTDTRKKSDAEGKPPPKNVGEDMSKSLNPYLQVFGGVVSMMDKKRVRQRTIAAQIAKEKGNRINREMSAINKLIEVSKGLTL